MTNQPGKLVQNLIFVYRNSPNNILAVKVCEIKNLSRYLKLWNA